tara:strand:+ start:513 stop:827 length:315 start_codon:yes stop_codon:yes gene_type:complete
MEDSEVNKKASVAARAIYKMNQLKVSQKDGAVRTGTGEIIGRQKWIVNVDYSLDTKEGEDFIVNAASQEEAEDKVENLIDGIARRSGRLKGATYINFSSPQAEI